MQDVYKDIDEYNEDKERKKLIVFDDMIADMINNKKLNSVVTELFISTSNLMPSSAINNTVLTINLIPIPRQSNSTSNEQICY